MTLLTENSQLLGYCHHGMARPQGCVWKRLSDIENGCEYTE